MQEGEEEIFLDQPTDLYGNALEGDDDFMGVIDDISVETPKDDQQNDASEVL